MKKNNSFSLKERSKSFKYAIEGIITFFKGEHNARIHLAATIAVIGLSIIFPVSRMEVIVLIFAVGFVWVAEIFNTAIEKMADFISKETNPAIKTIKDLSAAAVLVSAIIAVITGCLVFIPKL